MPRLAKSLACSLMGLLLLAGCGSNDQRENEPDEDPALSEALNEPIMTDVDLNSQNRANSAVAMPSMDGSIPSIDSGPEAVAAARTEALRLVGGPGRMRPAPEATAVSMNGPNDAALTAAARAAASPDVNAGCIEQVRYTMHWAAKLPAEFPVYPRGAVQEAAGTDQGECSLRVINFITPVPLDDVMDFYFTRASNAGFSARRTLQDGDDVLAGAKRGRSYSIYARRLRSGNTEVDLITNAG